MRVVGVAREWIWFGGGLGGGGGLGLWGLWGLRGGMDRFLGVE